jgi:hypothetical protein
MTTAHYVAYIGNLLRSGFANDWADRKHDIALYDCASSRWHDSVIPTRPQDILDWVNHLRARYGKDPFVFCEFLERFATVEAAQAATPDLLTCFFKAHQVVRRTAIARRIQQIQNAGPPLTSDAADRRA